MAQGRFSSPEPKGASTQGCAQSVESAAVLPTLEELLRQIEEHVSADVDAAGDDKDTHHIDSLESILSKLDEEERIENGAPSEHDTAEYFLGRQSVATYLGSEETPLVLAVQRQDLFQVQALCRDRADPNSRSLAGTAVIACAEQCGNVDLVALLLGWGASPALQSTPAHERFNEFGRAYADASIQMLHEIFINCVVESDDQRNVLAALDPGVLAQVRKRLRFRPPFALGGASPIDSLSIEPARHLEPSDDHVFHVHGADSMRPVLSMRPRHCQPSAMLVVLHGFLQSGPMLEQIARELSWALPHVWLLAPTAPTRGSNLGYGPSWFNFANTEAGEMQEHLEECRSEILRVLGQHGDSMPPRRVVLAGFSLGGCVAAHLALQVPNRMAGLVLLGTDGGIGHRLESFDSSCPGARGLPVLQCHGDCDQLVALERARANADWLRRLGCHVRFSPHEGVGHFLSAAMLAEMLAWLSEQLPPE